MYMYICIYIYYIICMMCITFPGMSLCFSSLCWQDPRNAGRLELRGSVCEL